MPQNVAGQVCTATEGPHSSEHGTAEHGKSMYYWYSAARETVCSDPKVLCGGPCLWRFPVTAEHRTEHCLAGLPGNFTYWTALPLPPPPHSGETREGQLIQVPTWGGREGGKKSRCCQQPHVLMNQELLLPLGPGSLALLQHCCPHLMLGVQNHSVHARFPLLKAYHFPALTESLLPMVWESYENTMENNLSPELNPYQTAGGISKVVVITKDLS